MRKKTRGNGQGTAFKRGNTWTAEVRYFDNGIMRRKKKGGFRTKTEALLFLPSLREMMNQEPVNVIGFADLWDKWTDSQTYDSISADKQRAYRIAYNKCTPLHRLSDVRMVSFDMMQDIIQDLTYYPARDVKRILNGMFELAMRTGCLERNLAPLLELPKHGTTAREVFTEEQIQKIADCPDEFKRYILLMIYMGLRPVEMMSMTVEDVHLEEHYTDGGRKTKQSQIVIFPDAEPILSELCQEKKTGRLCDMSEDQFYKQYYNCLESAGVEKHTPYSCRHTFVTRLTKSGMPNALIQKAARHTDYKTTQIYTHIDVSDVLKWVDA